MKVLEKETDVGIYSQELNDALEKLKEKEPPYEEIQYFIRIVEDYYSEKQEDIYGRAPVRPLWITARGYTGSGR